MLGRKDLQALEARSAGSRARPMHELDSEFRALVVIAISVVCECGCTGTMVAKPDGAPVPEADLL